MANIFTFGSCVSRDVFNHAPGNENEVSLNIQRMSMTLLPLKGYDINIEDIDMEYLDDFIWEVKMMLIEISKTALSMIDESNADYVVMDLIEERFDFAEFEIDGEKYTCIKSGHFDNFFEKYLKDKVTSYRETSIDEYDDEWIKKNLDIVIKRLCKKYSISKLILIETYYATEMIDDEGNITEYDIQEEIVEKNNRLHRMYGLMKEVLNENSTEDESFNLIEATENNLGYKNHKWGPFPVHYVDEFYENIGKAINIIIQSE